MKKRYLKYPLFFLLCVVILAGFLFLSAVVPREALAVNLEKSAQYYKDHSDFFELREGAYETTVDYYADTKWYNIIASIDNETPLRSAMEAAYYDSGRGVGIPDFIEVTEGEKANAAYTRYWHGTTVFLTFLLLAMDARAIYVLSGVLLAVLFFVLLGMLYRRKLYELLVSLTLAVVLCKGWIMALSLEYVMPALSSLGISIILLCLEKRKKKTEYLWICSGVFICFVDFLSTETLTLLLPLLIQTVLWHREGKSIKICGKNIVKAGLLWGASYGGMWIIKWGVASIVLGRNVFYESVFYAQFRVNSNIYMRQGTAERYLGSIVRNVRDIFPFCMVHEYGDVLLMIFVMGAILTAVVVLRYVRKRETQLVPLLLLIGTVPYIRYLVLSAHSYVHSFFTYRAQIVTIMAGSIALWYIVKRKSRS